MLAALPLGLRASSVTAGQTGPVKKLPPLPNAGEFVRFLDPITENPVVRLTTPVSSSLLPASHNHFVSVKDRFLIFSSDRSGRFCPYRLDLKTGAVTMIVPTTDIDPRSLSLDERQKAVRFLDGGVLKQLAVDNKKAQVQVIASNVTAYDTVAGGDFLVVRDGRLELLSNPQRPLAENINSWCLVRPSGNGCVFGRDLPEDQREFWYISFASSKPSPTLLARGRISNPFWSPDGQSLLLLREVAGDKNVYLSEVHQVSPETAEESRVDSTSQFAAFAPNGDASVFVGASRSKAQPTVILLLRAAQRELTLCEHRASHPSAVCPVFSPDSRRVYFESDRDGKSALYAVNVELLVEPTPSPAV